MSLLRGLFDRLVLVGGAVAGGLVPGFIVEYRQRLGGRLDQARLDLEPWQKIADQYHQGDFEHLIQYHLDSSNPTFHTEGAVIRALLNTVQQLQSAVDALHGSLFQQVGYLVQHGDIDLARATLVGWVPTFALSADGLTFALLSAVAIWLVFQVLWRLLALGGARFLGRSRPAVLFKY